MKNISVKRMNNGSSELTEWTLQKAYQVKTDVERFWKALDIYIQKPHILNRRLIGGEILYNINLKNESHLKHVYNILLSTECDGNIDGKLPEINNFVSNPPIYNNLLVIKTNLPKNKAFLPMLEIIYKDFSCNRVTFLKTKTNNHLIPNFSYGFTFESDCLNLWTEKIVDNLSSSYKWILEKVVPKLIKWMEEIIDEKKACILPSLNLVNVSEYSQLYNELKETYGKQLVKIWPENTDPLKFVYEDIGIATYLLLLWAGKPKQRFIDLGCGNGLLVHILNSEGHLGVGYDLRARKIWDMYPPKTKLEVRTIIPSSETVFPDTDWLIGNHSDELTLWIPVMAARSSYNCSFFLLPCCPYEFDGRKYCRTDTSVSQYADFLNYVEEVCKECGIPTGKDKLRIPSTKRSCFIGKGRSYPETELEENLNKLQEFIDSKCGEKLSKERNSDIWCAQFKPRAEEKVRNCTQIQPDIREAIVNLVAEQLLVKRRATADGWSYGGVVELCSLAKIVPVEMLKKLKNECGGLQTLLKNHHYIFKVQNGNVEFRIPTGKVKTNCIVWKKKPCWFYYNHPNSCPLEDENCSFIHNR